MPALAGWALAKQNQELDDMGAAVEKAAAAAAAAGNSAAAGRCVLVHHALPQTTEVYAVDSCSACPGHLGHLGKDSTAHRCCCTESDLARSFVLLLLPLPLPACRGCRDLSDIDADLQAAESQLKHAEIGRDDLVKRHSKLKVRSAGITLTADCCTTVRLTSP
jgi:hypothetical protein